MYNDVYMRLMAGQVPASSTVCVPACAGCDNKTGKRCEIFLIPALEWRKSEGCRRHNVTNGVESAGVLAAH